MMLTVNTMMVAMEDTKIDCQGQWGEVAMGKENRLKQTTKRSTSVVGRSNSDKRKDDQKEKVFFSSFKHNGTFFFGSPLREEVQSLEWALNR